MTKTNLFFLLLIWTVLVPGMVLAQAELQVKSKIRSGGTPLDTCFSLDGQLFFVLTRQGKLEIYSWDAVLKETLSLDFPADRVAAAKTGDTLFLTDSRTGDIRLVQVDFFQNINIKDSPFKGPEHAPVTIVVFTDFQCFYCSKILPLLEEVAMAYPEQVKIVIKNFPLSMHKSARYAAAGALAAHRQGRFWPMHDLLFDNANSLDPEKIKECARTIGLDMDQFLNDVDSPAIQLRVQTDFMDGRNAGVRGTPTLFINGRRLKQRSFEGFKAMIDQELKKKPQP